LQFSGYPAQSSNVENGKEGVDLSSSGIQFDLRSNRHT
jgi:NADH:ubiquinone oxidoreductase subunit D